MLREQIYRITEKKLVWGNLPNAKGKKNKV